MSDSDGSNESGPWLAAGIAFIVASLLVGAFYLFLDNQVRTYQRSAEQSASYIQRYADRQTNEGCSLGDLPQRVKCVADAQKAAHDDKRENDDLFAQRQMAVWAFAVAIGALISIPLTAAGIVFVWKNLVEMRRQHGVAERQLNAAVRNNRIMEAQVRARLVVEKVEILFIDNAYQATIRIRLRNIGLTAAEEVSAFYKIRKIGDPDFAMGHDLAGIKEQRAAREINGQTVDDILIYLEPGGIVEGGVSKAINAKVIIFHFDSIVFFKTGLDDDKDRVLAETDFTATFSIETSDIRYSIGSGIRWYPMSIIKAASAPWVRKFRETTGGKSFTYPKNTKTKN